MQIGLITYHTAYNFGSILQAYATQETIKSFGHDVEVINYRLKSQKNYYSLFPRGLGIGRTRQSIVALLDYAKRKRRQDKYEDCIEKLFKLTKEVNEPSEFYVFADKYDVYISGSDQIWNRYSNELRGIEWRRYMAPFLLEFTDKKKISYASSINGMKDEDLTKICLPLQKFEHISMREETGAQRLDNILGIKSETVIDPTLLVNIDIWNEMLKDWINTYTSRKFVVFYSLGGSNRRLIKDLSKIKRMVDSTLDIVVISPFETPLFCANIINASDACIYDFMGLIRDAEYVITSSYHGVMFSLIYEKKFFFVQMNKGMDSRVEDLKGRLGTDLHIVSSIDEINTDNEIDYDIIKSRIEELRNESIRYLENAINN